MKTKEIKIYEFKELDKKTKEKALENLRDINVNHDWDEYTLQEFCDELSDIGFENADIKYSGFWSQGDGLCFDADINLSKILEHLKYSKRDIARAVKLEENDYLNFQIVKTSNANMYSHENTRYVDNRGYGDLSKSIGIYKSDILIDKIEKDIEEFRHELCKKFYKLLDEEYDERTSDEQIIETIDANEYMFNSSGELE